MPKRRKFIGKNAVTYRVVPCELGSSQYDETAPKNILLPVSDNAKPIFPIPHSSVCKPPSESDRLFPTKGPRPDWDADVVAALDEDFNFKDPENLLEDDFIAKANAININDPENSEDDSSCDDESEVSDIDSLKFSECESVGQLKTYKRGTASQYSMTSAISNCSESVKTFNEHFEKILETYDDEEIGALDLEEIEGPLTDENQILQALCGDRKNPELVLGGYKEELKKHILNYAAAESKEKYVNIAPKNRPMFDCESILSTNSNLYNHPAVIKADYKKASSETAAKSSNRSSCELNESSEEESETDTPCRSAAVCSIRPKNETPEQRRERKKILKAAKREQRMLKKENKVAFKNQKKSLCQQDINIHHTMGIKLL